ncbi:MAG: aminotransferase class V-fold PLP-dependent enzyme, partial [Candidatus Methanofastidiosa archaeon]|nr:aminotransferase class V-fold PLP-dependent enzyme [Candidatus Methanofastidiosa archaeon]
MNRVYLDNSATTAVDPRVIEAMMPYFGERYGNASSLHSFGHEALEAVSTGRKQVATFLGATPKEVYFTAGGTESDNMALQGVAFARKEEGNHIITSSIEHPAVLET